MEGRAAEVDGISLCGAAKALSPSMLVVGLLSGNEGFGDYLVVSFGSAESSSTWVIDCWVSISWSGKMAIGDIIIRSTFTLTTRAIGSGIIPSDLHVASC